MSEYLYSKAQIESAVRRSDQFAAQRQAKTVSKEGFEITHSIPKELYFNAVVGHGVDPNDTGYWKDMERYVPSIKIKTASGKIMVSRLPRDPGIRRKNRFGVIAWSKCYR